MSSRWPWASIDDTKQDLEVLGPAFESIGALYRMRADQRRICTPNDSRRRSNAFDARGVMWRDEVFIDAELWSRSRIDVAVSNNDDEDTRVTRLSHSESWVSQRHRLRPSHVMIHIAVASRGSEDDFGVGGRLLQCLCDLSRHLSSSSRQQLSRLSADVKAGL